MLTDIGVAGIYAAAVYLVPAVLLTIGFVFDRFLVEPGCNASLLADRGQYLLVFTAGICLGLLLFWFNVDSALLLVLVCEMLVIPALTKASTKDDVYRSERIGLLIWLLWLAVPLTVGWILLQQSGD